MLSISAVLEKLQEPLKATVLTSSRKDPDFVCDIPVLPFGSITFISILLFAINQERN